MKERKERKTCDKCQKDFLVVWIHLGMNMDSKRTSSYFCPHCNKEFTVSLLGTEDIRTEKIN